MNEIIWRGQDQHALWSPARRLAHLLEGTTGSDDGDEPRLDGDGNTLGDLENLFLVDLLHL